MDKNKHYVYVLWNAARTHTYAGYTVNPKRRLRQHNGEIKGGAKYTSKYGPWSFAFVIACDTWDNHKALSFEWHIKPHSRKILGLGFSAIQRRFDLLCKAIGHPKFKELDFHIMSDQKAMMECISNG